MEAGLSPSLDAQRSDLTTLLEKRGILAHCVTHLVRALTINKKDEAVSVLALPVLYHRVLSNHPSRYWSTAMLSRHIPAFMKPTGPLQGCYDSDSSDGSARLILQRHAGACIKIHAPRYPGRYVADAPRPWADHSDSSCPGPPLPIMWDVGWGPEDRMRVPGFPNEAACERTAWLLRLPESCRALD